MPGKNICPGRSEKSRQSLVPDRSVQLHWREANLFRLAVHPEKDRRLVSVDVLSHDDAVAPRSGDDDFVGVNLPVIARAPPVLLEPLKAILFIELRMLLPDLRTELSRETRSLCAPQASSTSTRSHPRTPQPLQTAQPAISSCAAHVRRRNLVHPIMS